MLQLFTYSVNQKLVSSNMLPPAPPPPPPHHHWGGGGGVIVGFWTESIFYIHTYKITCFSIA